MSHSVAGGVKFTPPPAPNAKARDSTFQPNSGTNSLVALLPLNIAIHICRLWRADWAAVEPALACCHLRKPFGRHLHLHQSTTNYYYYCHNVWFGPSVCYCAFCSVFPNHCQIGRCSLHLHFFFLNWFGILIQLTRSFFSFREQVFLNVNFSCALKDLKRNTREFKIK